MTPKERVLRAIKRKRCDKIPAMIKIRREASKKLKLYLGVNKFENILEALSVDMWWPCPFDLVPLKDISERRKYPGDIEENVWGIKYKIDRALAREGYERIVFHPLAKIRNIDEYRFPDFSSLEQYNHIKNHREKYGDFYPVVASTTNYGLYMWAWMLRGFEKFNMDLYINKKFVNELIDRLTQVTIVQVKILARIGVDLIKLDDDIGQQHMMFISPEIWREIFKPAYRKIIKAIRESGQSYIMYHSDGYIAPIIGDLVEIGVDVLDPVQPECMNLNEIKKNYGDKLCLQSTISSQKTLPFGKPSDVAREVRDRIENLGYDGGLILGPTTEIQPDTPIENVLALYKACRGFGSIQC